MSATHCPDCGEEWKHCECEDDDYFGEEDPVDLLPRNGHYGTLVDEHE